MSMLPLFRATLLPMLLPRRYAATLMPPCLRFDADVAICCR